MLVTPVLRGLETGGFLRLVGSQSSSKFSERLLQEKQQRDRVEQTPDVLLWMMGEVADS